VHAIVDAQAEELTDEHAQGLQISENFYGPLKIGEFDGILESKILWHSARFVLNQQYIFIYNFYVFVLNQQYIYIYIYIIFMYFKAIFYGSHGQNNAYLYQECVIYDTFGTNRFPRV
jgi:hypothetical protein